MRTLQYSLKQQSGIALVVSFIILLLLTIIGVSGMKVTGLEEKMASNDRDQNVAFQSAEAALRAGEQRVMTLWDNGNGSIKVFCNGTTKGLFHEVNVCINDASANSPPAFAATTWTDDNSVEVKTVRLTNAATGALLVAEYPRYYISYEAHIAPLTRDNPPQYRFMVTARGTGGQEGSQVILRSHFGGTASFTD